MVAQLVERSLPTPEIRGSNLNIGKFYLPIIHLNRKDKNKGKEARNGPSLKKGCLMYIDQRHSTSSSSVCRKLFSVCDIVHDTNVIFFLHWPSAPFEPLDSRLLISKAIARF